MKNIYIVVGIIYDTDQFEIEGCYLSRINAEKRKIEVEKQEKYRDEKMYDFVVIETKPILN